MLPFRAPFLFAILMFFDDASSAPDDTGAGRPIFLYPGKAKSERDLRSCGEREVCSIVHKRFFYPASVERFCGCVAAECPSTWTETPDNYTMHANNRAQLKFCEPIVDLPSCLDTNETTAHYLMVKNVTVSVPSDPQSNQSTEDYEITSMATCYCPPHNKWICSWLESNSSTQTTILHFRCAPLAKCNADEFCGSERQDYYSVYYHCSCPTGHLCIRQYDSQFQIKEIFYNGAAYKAQCTNFPLLH